MEEDKKDNIDSKQNILISQQMTNAFNDFTSLLDLTIDDKKIHVILLQNNIPVEIRSIERDLNIFYARNGIVKCMFYYDPSTLTYRVSGGLNFTYDFIFIDTALENSRQTLEVVHSLYIQTYSSSDRIEYIEHLTKKFIQLTDKTNNTPFPIADTISDMSSIDQKIKIE